MGKLHYIGTLSINSITYLNFHFSVYTSSIYFLLFKNVFIIKFNVIHMRILSQNGWYFLKFCDNFVTWTKLLKLDWM